MLLMCSLTALAAHRPSRGASRLKSSNESHDWEKWCRANGQNETLGRMFVDKHAAKSFIRERNPLMRIAEERGYITTAAQGTVAAVAIARAVTESRARGEGAIIFKASHFSGGVLSVQWNRSALDTYRVVCLKEPCRPLLAFQAKRCHNHTPQPHTARRHNHVAGSFDNMSQVLQAVCARWLNSSYSSGHKHPHETGLYRKVRRGCVFERHLEDLQQGAPRVARLFMWHGVLGFIDVDGPDGVRSAHYTHDWRPLRVSEQQNNHMWPERAERPPYWLAVLADATRLSAGFAFVRVDVFLLRDYHVFSELTFSPVSCRAGPLVPGSVDRYLGSLGDRNGEEQTRLQRMPPEDARARVARTMLGLVHQHEEKGFVWRCSLGLAAGGACEWKNATKDAPIFGNQN
jgi:hypothetical protein